MEWKNEIKYSLILKPYHNKSSDKVKKNFDKLTDILMSYFLFPFFEMFEAKELGKINIQFYNSFVYYSKRFYENEISKYNLEIPKEQKFVPYELYKQKDDKGHFIKLKYQTEHYLLFSYFDWEWKNDDRYWIKKTFKNSILKNDIYYLKTVCLIDINTKMSHIFSGNYKLYLNHCVCWLNKAELNLIIEIDGVVYKKFNYPTKEQKDNCLHDENSLFNQYITDIDVAYNENLEKEGGHGHEIAIKFKNNNWEWKYDWAIDTIILRKKFKEQNFENEQKLNYQFHCSFY